MDTAHLFTESDNEIEDVKNIESIHSLPFYQTNYGRGYEVTFKQLANLIRQKHIQSLKAAINKQNVQLIDEGGRSILHVAVASNSEEIMNILLNDRRCFDIINYQDPTGTTPLGTALQKRCYNTLEVLCMRGADPTLTHAVSGGTALHLTALNGDVKAAKILLKYYPNPDFINSVNSLGDTALTEAVHRNTPVFDLLIEAGANITLQNPENGRTMLHVTVAYNRHSILEKTMQHSDASLEFVEARDVQGDSALLIAVKLQNLDTIKTLTNKYHNLLGINHLEVVSVLHLAIDSGRDDILKHLLNYTSPSSLDFLNSNFRTPIMYAAEMDVSQCLEDIIKFGAEYKKKTLDTGETLLHLIAKNHSNSTLRYILKLHDIIWFFEQKDYDGNTPYMTAIKNGNDVFLSESFKVKKIDLCEYSPEGETAPYYCLKQGYPRVLSSLLLSHKYYLFAREKQDGLDITDPEVLKLAEIREDIHATDLYILTGKIIKYPLVSYFPPNLIIKVKENRNVFHACSLGGSLESLKFLHEMFKLYAPKYFLDDFDSQGFGGDTPLFLAAQCGKSSEQCLEYYVKNGADLSSTSKSGINVIQSIFANNRNPTDVFIRLFNSCVSAEKENYYSDKSNIKVNFDLFCPKGKNQMNVLLKLFNEAKGRDRRQILQHPVIVIFLKTKLKKIQYWFFIRCLSEVLSTLIVTIVLPSLYVVNGHPIDQYGAPLYMVMKAASIITAITCCLHVFLKIPSIALKCLWFTDVISVLPFVALIVLLFCGEDFYFNLELAALVILSSWMCLLVFTIIMDATFSYQLAVFFRLLRNISQHLIVLVVLIISFSLSFSCIHHVDKRFSNFHSSFLYTFIVMLPGFLSDMPTFEKEYYKNTNMGFHFVVECFILGCFLICAITGFVNMLIGLAVRGGQYLEADGRVFQNHHVVHYLSSVEFWFNNWLYYWMVKKNIFKFLKKRNHITIVDLNFNVYDENNKDICDDELLGELRSIVVKEIEEPKKRSKNASHNLFDGKRMFGRLSGQERL